MFDKHDARTLLTIAMGVALDDELKHGVRAEDVLDMFKYVQELYAAEGTTMKYTWVRIGKNQSKKGSGWKGADCAKTFSRIGKFVVLGAAKKNDDRHGKLMKAMSKKSMSEIERAGKYGIYAKGTKTINHAISIVIDDEFGRGMMFDNGCEDKKYSILSIASRMEDVSVCYKMDLNIV